MKGMDRLTPKRAEVLILPILYICEGVLGAAGKAHLRVVLHVPTLGMLIQSLRLLQPRTTRRQVCLADVVTGLAISPLENGPSDCGNLGEDGLEGLRLQVQGLLSFGAKRSHPWFHAYSLGGHPPSPHLFRSNQVIR